MIWDPLLVLLFIGIIFSIFFFSTTNNFINQKVYGHIFSTDETASFVAFANQLQIESELVQTNLANNNISLAQKHANKGRFTSDSKHNDRNCRRKPKNCR